MQAVAAESSGYAEQFRCLLERRAQFGFGFLHYFYGLVGADERFDTGCGP
jgi:hypothetical protein